MSFGERDADHLASDQTQDVVSVVPRLASTKIRRLDPGDLQYVSRRGFADIPATGCAMTGPVHGRIGTYTNHGCRCDACVDVQAAYRQARIRLGQQHPELIPHGTPGGYANWYCRCPACRAANTAARRATRRLRRYTP